ncbi:MAG: hypothetical protein ACYC1Z_13235 [Georgenia sp.]
MSNVNTPVVGPATASRRGTMSAADKAKLDGYPDTPSTGAVSSVTEANGLTLTAGDLALGAAGAAAAGAVTTGAQEFGGAKTLTGAILAGVTTITEAVTALVRAVGVSLVLRSSLGAGASDKCVVVGSSEADGTANAAARLQEWQTGIGGTPVTKAWIRKRGSFVNTDGLGLGMSADLDNVAAGLKYDTQVRLGVFSLNGASGIFVNLGSGRAGSTGDFDAGASLNTASTVQLNTGGNARPAASATTRGTLWYSKSAASAADTVEICLKSAADTYSWVVISTG